MTPVRIGRPIAEMREIEWVVWQILPTDHPLEQQWWRQGPSYLPIRMVRAFVQTHVRDGTS